MKIWGFITLIYFFGISLYIYTETHFYWQTLKLTPKIVRKSFLWPILSVICFIKLTTKILHYWIGLILLVFNCKYMETEIYRFIESKLEIE